MGTFLTSYKGTFSKSRDTPIFDKIILHLPVAQEYVETLVKELDPALLMLLTRCGSVSEGEALLEKAKH